MRGRAELENLIFKRAAFAKETVFGKRGALYSMGKDNYLHQLLQLYNQFFKAENEQAFLEETDVLWGENYKYERPFYGGLIPFQDLKAEIFFEHYFLNLLTVEKEKIIDKKNKL